MQDETAAGVRRQADAHEGLNKFRFFGRNAQIAGEGEIATGAGRDAVDGGDHNRFHLAELANHRVVFLAQRRAQRAFLFRRAAFQILAGAKGPARAGDHHAAHFLVALAVFQRFENFLVHLRHEGIQRLRPIERDRADAV